MGGFFKPRTDQVNPNIPEIRGLQGGLADLLMRTAGGQGPSFLTQTSDLQRQGMNAVGSLLGSNPEQQTLDMLQNPLMQLVNAGAGGIGGFEQSQRLVGAAQPIFQQNLQGALGQLSNAAPGRFSTAFASQGQGLAQRALQDFNLFQQQATQAGLGLDLQARGLAQQGILGAGTLLGSLSQSAGNAPFQRALGAGQLGLAATQQAVNPTLQLLLGGLGFAQPQGMDTVVGKSPFGHIKDIGAIIAAMRGGSAGNVGTG